VIDSDLELHGMNAGHATVVLGVTLVLHGMVTGNLTVEADAMAVVRGTISGTVTNRGGDVTVFGTVGAIADADPKRATKIMPHATVGR
jgi:hypothetical protein